MSELRTKILAKKTGALQPYEVKEWETTVFLRKWKMSERLAYNKWLKANKDNSDDDASARLLIMSLVDKDGQPVFTQEDTATINDFPGELVDRLVLACCAYNGMSEEKLEQARKNS